ncbi:MAG: MotA/TolQ/ExbB proton channel family protein [Balneolaceae bacterium]
MDKSTIYGLMGAFLLVLGAITFQGDLGLFLSLSSIFIVAGGVICVTIVNFSFYELKNAFKNLRDNLKNSEVDLRTDIELMNMFARKIRRGGMLAMEEDINNIEDTFLRNGFMYAMDGVKKETLIHILSDQLESAERMMEKSVRILASMAEYSPAFGMIGTVIGLILMLQNIQDPESLGVGLALALLTTLYGTILANMIFIPLSGKLDNLSEKQLTRKRMYKAAVISIIEEENPRIMENKLLNYLLPLERAEYLAYYDKNSFTQEREEQLYEKWKLYQNKPWQNLVADLAVG